MFANFLDHQPTPVVPERSTIQSGTIVEGSSISLIAQDNAANRHPRERTRELPVLDDVEMHKVADIEWKMRSGRQDSEILETALRRAGV
jgi:hypothetical protein